jgi:diguanylate cyclase (GGDEF)-like protein/PAS domain S-box-containing protein
MTPRSEGKMKPTISHEAANDTQDVWLLSPSGQTLADKIVETSPDGIMVCGCDARIVWVNPAFMDMTGFDVNEVIGATPRILRSGFHDETFYQGMRAVMAKAGRWQSEIWNRHKSGRVFPAWVTLDIIRGVSGKTEHYYVARYYGLEDQRSLPGFLHRMAYFDSVTGLPNRNLFLDRLQQALIRAIRANTSLAVLFIDMDNFKMINDTFGHDCGDQMLRGVAERLAHCMREGDTLSRFGGDEFAAVLPDLADCTTAALVAERILQGLAAPFFFNGESVIATASIGISLFPSDGRDAIALVKHADAAMYCIKKTRGHGYHFFGN